MGLVVCTGDVCLFNPQAQPAVDAVESLSEAEFRARVLEAGHPVVVEFHRSEGCSRCRAAAPVVERLAEQHRDALEVLKVDVDQNPGLAERYGVGPLPHFSLFSGGRLLATERPELIPGEVKKRRFDHAQVEKIFGRAAEMASSEG